MIRMIIVFLGLIAGLSLSGCASNPPRGIDSRMSVISENKIPEWFLDPPVSEDFLAPTVGADFGNLAANYLSAAMYARNELLQQREVKFLNSQLRMQTTARSVLYGSRIERAVVYPEEACVYVMGVLPFTATRETTIDLEDIEVFAQLTGLGVGVKLTGEDGRSVDARTVAEWSARVDLSQVLWLNAGNRTVQFAEEVGDQGDMMDNFVSVTEFQFPLLPASLVEVVETHSLTDDIVVTHVRLRPEWRLEWALLLDREFQAGSRGQALQATMKLYMEEKTLAGSPVQASHFEYLGPEFSMRSRYFVQSGKEVTRSDSLVCHPAPDGEESLRDWLSFEAFARVFQGKAGFGQEKVENGEKPYGRFRATEAFKELEKELEEYEKQQEK